MRSEFTIEQTLLADYMSLISERCYCAGWMNNLQYVLWHSISAGPRQYGQDFITLEDIIHLNQMARASNSWIVYDELLGETAIDLKEWQFKFKSDLIKEPRKLLEG